ncbi:unnamed protein product [Boreogadus saida]
MQRIQSGEMEEFLERLQVSDRGARKATGKEDYQTKQSAGLCLHPSNGHLFRQETAFLGRVVSAPIEAPKLAYPDPKTTIWGSTKTPSRCQQCIGSSGPAPSSQPCDCRRGGAPNGSASFLYTSQIL